MKSFLVLLAATALFCGCNRFSAEESAAFHKHGSHDEAHGADEHGGEKGKKSADHSGH